MPTHHFLTEPIHEEIHITRIKKRAPIGARFLNQLKQGLDISHFLHNTLSVVVFAKLVIHFAQGLQRCFVLRIDRVGFFKEH